MNFAARRGQILELYEEKVVAMLNYTERSRMLRRKEAIDTTSLDPDFSPSPPLFSTLNLHATFTLYVVRTT